MFSVIPPDRAAIFYNPRTGRTVRPVTFHFSVHHPDVDDEGTVWTVDLADGHKNHWKLRVFEQEFQRTDEELLCGHCGFLEVEPDEIICEHCRDRFQ